MMTHTVPITGRQPVRFTGDLICDLRSPMYSRVPVTRFKHVRWFEARAFVTRATSIIVAYSYRFRGHLPHERHHDELVAYVPTGDMGSQDWTGLAAHLAAAPIESMITGYRCVDTYHQYPKWKRLHDKLLGECRRDWDSLSADIVDRVRSALMEPVTIA